MNIYDFDGTIYDGDTCRDIVIYGLKKYPKLTIQSIRNSKSLEKEYQRGLIEFERVKEELLSFIFKINNYPKFVNDFVDSHMKKIKPFYLSRRTENDVIVSASYDLWINLFARRLGIKKVIATKVDASGKIIGKNCKGIEKVNRFKTEFPNETVSSAYSDSSVDIPMLELTPSSFVVEGNKILTYRRGYKFKNNK